MAHRFVEIAPAALADNVFRVIGRDAMLITAGTPARFNTMTASWGGWGHLWNRDVTFSFVRPQRYTFGFMEGAEHYTLCFFAAEHQAALDFCGSHSGRDVDKIAATGLTPVADDATGAVYFAEARLALVCRKLYAQDLTADSFVDRGVIGETYAKADFHRMYVGHIVRGLIVAGG
jgi:flavin reductase (DIM6/NTAB) family NADH-FMN oxidoreductase RutF